MNKFTLLLGAFLWSVLTMAQNVDAARTAELAKKAIKEAKEDGWLQGGGFGVDLGQLLQINPKVGAGENRLGVGGAITYFAKYKKGLLSFDNIGSLNLSEVKLGLHIRTTTGIYLQKRTAKDIWQGLYELPLIESAKALGKERMQVELQRLLGPGWTITAMHGPMKHVLSHQHLHTKFWEVSPPRKSRLPKTWFAVNAQEMNSYALPRLLDRYLNKAQL